MSSSTTWRRCQQMSIGSVWPDSTAARLCLLWSLIILFALFPSSLSIHFLLLLLLFLVLLLNVLIEAVRP